MLEVARAGDLRQIVLQARRAGKTVGLVPTMGYLHEGHLRLAARARADTDLVIMSIFVNPTQFGPSEDLARYPRDLARDREMAQGAGVDVLFVPDVEEMYPVEPEGQAVWVDPGDLARYLCGASRPGHFRGVATVVAKLLNMAQPDRAYFGQKDAQQGLIVQAMARDLAFAAEIVLVPTVREADGLALSSRNVYLTEEQRQHAVALWSALQDAAEAVERGERDAQRLEARLRQEIARVAPDARLDYAAVVDLTTLHPVQGTIAGDVLVAVAVYFGSTRLIDNIFVSA